MDASDFHEKYSELAMERHRLADLRNDLETELSEVRTKLNHLDEVLNHLSPLAGITSTDDELAGLGITDAVRYVLRNSSTKLAARDIQQQLIEKGYDLSGLSAPMASIYKILGRLADNSETVERVRDERGRVYYAWKTPPISDEDIPF
jgi:hypothetical protein